MSLINQSYTLSASVSAGLLTVNFLNALTGAAPTAADPVAITFRDPTLANGDTVTGLVTSALSINTNGIGATLGSQNGVPFRLWIVACYNGGAPVLALRNCSNATQIFRLPQYILHNTTAISNSATSAGVFYTPNGVNLTNTPIKILGYLEYASGLTTAGNYTAGPTQIQLFGLGIPLPGSVIQEVCSGPISTSTNLQTASTQTAVTVSITPTSTVNLIEVSANVQLGGGAGSNNILELSRGTGPTTFGQAASITSGAQQSQSPLFGIDSPGTTSATAYYVFGKCNTNNNGVVNDASALYPPSSIITAKEIMG
jgi:hypothetical protein